MILDRMSSTTVVIGSAPAPVELAIGRPKAYTPAGALETKVPESHAGQDRNPILGLLTSIRDTHGSVLKSSEGVSTAKRNPINK